MLAYACVGGETSAGNLGSNGVVNERTAFVCVENSMKSLSGI